MTQMWLFVFVKDKETSVLW